MRNIAFEEGGRNFKDENFYEAVIGSKPPRDGWD